MMIRTIFLNNPSPQDSHEPGLLFTGRGLHLYHFVFVHDQALPARLRPYYLALVAHHYAGGGHQHLHL